MQPATSPEVARTGAPAPRVPPLRLAAVLVLTLLLAGAVALRVARSGEGPDPAVPPARPADPSAELDAKLAGLEARVAAAPTDARGWQELGLALHDKNLRTGDLALSARALAALVRADELLPGDPAIITARAVVTASRHDFAGARRLVQPVVDTDPFAADARVVLVDALVELGLYADAERHLDELGRLRPGLAVLSRMSYVRELHGDLPGALLAMRQASATAPRHPWELATVHTLTGDLLLLQGRIEPALTELDRALAALPGLPGAVASRAAALAAAGRYEEAVAGLEAHLGRRRDVAVASMLAELRGLRGQPTGDLDRLIDEVLAEEAAAGYDNVLERADVALGRGDVETARPLAEAAYAARPDNVFAAEVLAAVRLADGDVAGAVPLAVQATRLDSADLHQHLRAAEIHLAAGDPATARAQLARAFELAPHPAPSVVAGARRLAGRLGVEPPASWGGPT